MRRADSHPVLMLEPGHLALRPVCVLSRPRLCALLKVQGLELAGEKAGLDPAVQVGQVLSGPEVAKTQMPEGARQPSTN